MNNNKPHGYYRHYKGHKYEILDTGLNSETLEEVVIYRSCEENSPYPAGTIWVRPLRMFTEEVTVNGTIMPRFSKL